MKRVVVLADAAEDIESARDFYEGQEVGVGEYCVDSLLTDLESLARFSGIHPLHFKFHRMLASRFPFGIYYREYGEETQVLPSWICDAIRTGFVKNWGNAQYKIDKLAFWLCRLGTDIRDSRISQDTSNSPKKSSIQPAASWPCTRSFLSI